MPENAIRNYDVKVVTRSQAVAYQSFGWVRSKDPVPPDTKVKSKKEPLLVLKRKLEFGLNPKLAAYEKEYQKLEKKKYRSKPILGILAFILMLAFLLVTGVELYFGISAGLEKMNAGTELANESEKAASAAEPLPDASTPGETATDETATEDGGILGTIKGILETVKADYLSKVTGLFDGKTDETTSEYTPGIADTLSDMLGEPIGYFISGDTIVALISLILAIIFIILFAKVCGLKKKRIAKAAKMEDIRESAEDIVDTMRRNDLSLMGKSQRKQYMWETIITNAIRNANNYGNDDDDE